MGDELVIYLRESDADGMADSTLSEEEQVATKTDQFLMTVDPNVDMEAGQRVKVVFDRTKLHLFDTSSGEALVHGIGQEAEQVSR